MFEIRENAPSAKAIVSVTKPELIGFLPPDLEDEPLVEQHTTAAFTIISLSFQEDNKWRLHDGQNPVWAKIEDENFLKRVDSNDISFSKGDILLCEVIIAQWQTSSGLRTDTRIIKVIEHRSAARQLGLPFVEQRDADAQRPETPRGPGSAE